MELLVMFVIFTVIGGVALAIWGLLTMMFMFLGVSNTRALSENEAKGLAIGAMALLLWHPVGWILLASYVGWRLYQISQEEGKVLTPEQTEKGASDAG